MFTDFFYTLKKVGIPVSPTSFLRLQKALSMGLINSVDDFYTGARTILVKSEKYFDLYDQVFAHQFKGAELKEPDEVELSEVARALLEEWLKDPKALSDLLGVNEEDLAKKSTVLSADARREKEKELLRKREDFRDLVQEKEEEMRSKA